MREKMTICIIKPKSEWHFPRIIFYHHYNNKIVFDIRICKKLLRDWHDFTYKISVQSSLYKLSKLFL